MNINLLKIKCTYNLNQIMIITNPSTSLCPTKTRHRVPLESNRRTKGKPLNSAYKYMHVHMHA